MCLKGMLLAACVCPLRASANSYSSPIDGGVLFLVRSRREDTEITCYGYHELENRRAVQSKSQRGAIGFCPESTAHRAQRPDARLRYSVLVIQVYLAPVTWSASNIIRAYCSMATTELDGDELERAFDEAAWDAEEITQEDVPTVEGGDNPARSHRAPMALLHLPREMLLRVLSLVPATGLTSCACVCKALSALASDDTVWRRLYVARWGKPNQQVRGSARWKRVYLDADSEEWEATTRSNGSCNGSGSFTSGGSSSSNSSSSYCNGGGNNDDPFLGAMFLDMLRAKRDLVPDRRLLDRAAEVDPGDIAAKVAAWRRARGFHQHDGSGAGADTSGSSDAHPPPPPRPDLSHRGRASLSFTRVNPGELPPVYACDQTGELLVCPVSGQTTDRLVHECEEGDGEEDDGGRCGVGGGGRGGAGEEDAGLGVFGGGFGSFFAAGYECENEKALNKLLGYKALQVVGRNFDPSNSQAADHPWMWKELRGVCPWSSDSIGDSVLCDKLLVWRTVINQPAAFFSKVLVFDMDEVTMNLFIACCANRTAKASKQVAQHYKTASEAQQTQKQLNDMSQLLPYKEVIRLAREGDPHKTSLVACLASLSSEQRAYLGAALTGQTKSASRRGAHRDICPLLGDKEASWWRLCFGQSGLGEGGILEGGIAPGAYPGGWYRCTTCLLAVAGIGSVALGSVTEELAQLAVALHGSAVADSSSVTYESRRRRCRANAEPRRATEFTQDACWQVLGFFGMLRRSELAALTVGCVEELPGGGVGLQIVRSKTDQKGAGTLVCLAALTQSGIPIARIQRHLECVRTAEGHSPLFVRGITGPGKQGTVWRRGDFTSRLHVLLGELQGYEPELKLDLARISAHSLRKGGATAAANAGVGLEEIKAHGRWRSDAVLVYIRRSVAEDLLHTNIWICHGPFVHTLARLLYALCYEPHAPAQQRSNLYCWSS
ncbi:hypothetical protein VOLCADRAFT_121049 [Volvox carteri f. nagariensis]|uniref:F-box domain-containing protein n=1 Tax=Volvox carteri f. nagariensis TaxID=3068 RepID=D8U0D3_VOLCA|nr:uncharacterized protein VOLCADRAFT_121049 [Volvox carteri f. nagariensis]EFJ46922.1 hypothetical protein VOLCADRAFT_121049 [Volvox carteri f. nagariensis]|eukprot:XP_002952131.1 hypothetical protein VOLCADRAFT_121049 [Volvox carteri f. nagariensis]